MADPGSIKRTNSLSICKTLSLYCSFCVFCSCWLEVGKSEVKRNRFRWLEVGDVAAIRFMWETVDGVYVVVRETFFGRGLVAVLKAV